MARNQSSGRSLALALVLGTALTTSLPAFALEAEPFAQAFKALIAEQDGNLEYEGATLDGVSVTLTGATLSPSGDLPAQDGASMTLPLGDLTFEGVTETDTGYEATSLIREGIEGSAADVGEEGDDLTWSIGRLGMEGITVPRADADGQAAIMARSGAFYDRAFLENVTLSLNGEQYVTLASAETRTDIDADPATLSASMTDLVTDLTVAADKAPDLKAWIEGTGYDTITIDYASDGTWNLTDGTLDLGTNRVTLEGMGEFDLALNLGGLTPTFLETMNEVAAQMQSDDEQARQAAGMQLLGLASQLSFGELTLGYRDGGMADTLLEYYASVENTTKEQLVQQTAGVLPIALGQLGVPELQAQITEAVTDFLNDPKSITVSLKPDAPVPAPVLMGAAASSPAQLVQALNASVTSGEAGSME